MSNDDQSRIGDQVWSALSTIDDPELGVPITDLGLIYSVEIMGTEVQVVMTTTTPLCPLGSYLERQVQRKLVRLEGIDNVTVTLTHDPLWCPEMMNEMARATLGCSPGPRPNRPEVLKIR